MTTLSPTIEQPFRLGTRRSPLAMAQAHETRERLIAAHGWDADAVELVPVLASGDKIKDRPLAEIGGKALWTKELDRALADRTIHAAVHSMKDVETWRPDELTIAALLPREDVRDMLIGAANIAAIPRNARVGTSAPRRAAQMLHARPDVTIVGFRGNVATRLSRLQSDEADVTLLAAAGLVRLGQTGVGRPLDPAEWLPAPAQGAIGVECRTDDAATRAALAAIDHGPTRAQVMAERALLDALGGTCHSPIAAWTRGETDLTMDVALFSGNGAVRRDGSVTFTPGDEGPVRAMAMNLLARSPQAITANFRG